jgi:membrane associated rhomboid family serine protease
MKTLSTIAVWCCLNMSVGQPTPQRKTRPFSPYSPSALALRAGGGAPSLGYELNPEYTSDTFQKTWTTVGDSVDDPLFQHNSFGNYILTPTKTYTINTVTRNPEVSNVNALQNIWTNIRMLSPTIANTAASCVIVFLLWQLPIFQPLLSKFFVCSRLNIRKGRMPAILLSAISHTSAMHLLFNLFALLSFGPSVSQILKQKRWAMWPLMLGAALSGSIGYIFLDRAHTGGCVGLSGVTCALLAVYAQLMPTRTLGIRIGGIFPVRMPASQLLWILLGWSAFNTVVATRSSIAHSCHLGGLLFGVAYHNFFSQAKTTSIPKWLSR